MDTRRREIIGFDNTNVTRRLYVPPFTMEVIDMGSEVAKYRVKAPVLRPSVVVFTICAIIISVLVIAEVLTQRRKRRIGGTGRLGEHHSYLVVQDGDDKEDEIVELVEEDGEIEMRDLSLRKRA